MVSMPFRANHEVAYEPARPSPIIETDVSVGTDVMANYEERIKKIEREFGYNRR